MRLTRGVTPNRAITRFGTTEATRGVEPEIADRKFCVWLGLSGSGKSALLRIVAGSIQSQVAPCRISERRARKDVLRDRA